MATSTGFNGYNANVGDMRNSGFEFEIRGTAIRTDDFRLEYKLDGINCKNKVLKLTNTAPEIINKSLQYQKRACLSIRSIWLNQQE